MIDETRSSRLLAKCPALYVGSSIPIDTIEGLDALQKPLLELYPTDKNERVRGVDSSITIFSTGVQLESGGQSPALYWFSIDRVYLAAAVKCVNYVDAETGIKVGTKFVSLDSPDSRYSSHLPLFTLIVRRTQGRKVLECHCLVAPDEMTAVKLVEACEFAYEHRDNPRDTIYLGAEVMQREIELSEEDDVSDKESRPKDMRVESARYSQSLNSGSDVIDEDPIQYAGNYPAKKSGRDDGTLLKNSLGQFSLPQVSVTRHEMLRSTAADDNSSRRLDAPLKASREPSVNGLKRSPLPLLRPNVYVETPDNFLARRSLTVDARQMEQPRDGRRPTRGAASQVSRNSLPESFDRRPEIRIPRVWSQALPHGHSGRSASVSSHDHPAISAEEFPEKPSNTSGNSSPIFADENLPWYEKASHKFNVLESASHPAEKSMVLRKDFVPYVNYSQPYRDSVSNVVLDDRPHTPPEDYAGYILNTAPLDDALDDNSNPSTMLSTTVIEYRMGQRLGRLRRTPLGHDSYKERRDNGAHESDRTRGLGHRSRFEGSRRYARESSQSPDRRRTMFESNHEFANERAFSQSLFAERSSGHRDANSPRSARGATYVSNGRSSSANGDSRDTPPPITHIDEVAE